MSCMQFHTRLGTRTSSSGFRFGAAGDGRFSLRCGKIGFNKPRPRFVRKQKFVAVEVQGVIFLPLVRDLVCFFEKGSSVLRRIVVGDGPHPEERDRFVIRHFFFQIDVKSVLEEIQDAASHFAVSRIDIVTRQVIESNY
jgi:hypothetical protein